MSDIVEQVEKAVESFDLTEFVTSTTAVPQDTVTVYTDVQGAYEIDQLKRQHESAVLAADKNKDKTPKGITDEPDPIIEDFEERVEAILERIKGTALTLHMRAVNEPERRVIIKGVYKDIKSDKNMTEEERGEAEVRREEESLLRWYAASVTKIERADGAVIDKVGVDHLRTLRDALYDSEWAKIGQMFEQLSFASHLVDRAVDAGFRSGATA